MNSMNFARSINAIRVVYIHIYIYIWKISNVMTRECARFARSITENGLERVIPYASSVRVALPGANFSVQTALIEVLTSKDFSPN